MNRFSALDDRLSRAAALFPACEYGADIGADHGRLSCYLLANQRCSRMCVADISADSLEKMTRELERKNQKGTGALPEVPLPETPVLNSQIPKAEQQTQPEKAEETWTQAILSDPVHVDARFNRELKLLREGKKFDFEVIEGFALLQ